LWPSINGSDGLGASSLDGSSLGTSVNEGVGGGGDDNAEPLGAVSSSGGALHVRQQLQLHEEATQQGHHHHVHRSEQRAARKFRRLLQACWPHLPPSLRAWLFSGAFLRECAAKFEALDTGAQGHLNLGQMKAVIGQLLDGLHATHAPVRRAPTAAAAAEAMLAATAAVDIAGDADEAISGGGTDAYAVAAGAAAAPAVAEAAASDSTALDAAEPTLGGLSAAAMVRSFDADGDGAIDAAEFVPVV
jgi:hypothetical protein